MSRIGDLIAAHCPDGVRHMLLKEIASYSDSRIDASKLDETTFVGVDNLLADKAGKTDATYLPNTARLTRYFPGEILLGNIRPYLKKVWLADGDGGCSGDVLALRIDPVYVDAVEPRFLYYLLSSDGFFAYNMRHANGAKMPRGNKTAILEYRVPVPPIEVQREIVRILDQFTALEAELEARRRQYAHYRDTMLAEGVPRTLKLGDLAEFKYGYTAKAADSGDFRFLRITDILPSGKLAVDGSKYVVSGPGVRDYEVCEGDLLMARTGATYGKTMLVEGVEPAVYASFLIRIRLDETKLLPTFYWHFAQSREYWHQAEQTQW